MDPLPDKHSSWDLLAITTEFPTGRCLPLHCRQKPTTGKQEGEWVLEQLSAPCAGGRVGKDSAAHWASASYLWNGGLASVIWFARIPPSQHALPPCFHPIPQTSSRPIRMLLPLLKVYLTTIYSSVLGSTCISARSSLRIKHQISKQANMANSQVNINNKMNVHKLIKRAD